MAIKKGDKIKVEYEGTLDDGTVFDSSKKHGVPLEFEVGSGQIIKGFDKAVIGMEKDEEKEIKLSSAEAYGERKEELMKEFPREMLPKEPEPKVGAGVMLGTPDGKKIPAMIKEVKDKVVVIDLNHPLAGKALNFKIKIVDITTA